MPNITPYSQSELFPMLRTLANDKEIIITRHARLRMEERDISYIRIYNALLNPKFLIGTRFNIKHNAYNYKIKGGLPLVSVVVAISNNKIVVVTVI